jgi:hypothetical protein
MDDVEDHVHSELSVVFFSQSEEFMSVTKRLSRLFPILQFNSNYLAVHTLFTRRQYSETCLKAELGRNLSLVENFYSPRIWSPEYPSFKNMYDKEPVCNEKKFRTPDVPLWEPGVA